MIVLKNDILVFCALQSGEITQKNLQKDLRVTLPSSSSHTTEWAPP